MTRLLDLQRTLLAIVAERGPLVERLDRICRAYERAIEGVVATVMRLETTTQRLSFISAPTAPSDLLDALDRSQVRDGNGSCAHAAWSGEPTYVDDATEDPHWARVRKVAKRFHVRSCWSTPVRDREGHIRGTFALTSLKTMLPDHFQRRLLDLGAMSVGLLFDQELDNARRAESERAARRLALAADHNPNGILFTDADHRIEWTNQSAGKLLGRPPSELAGMPLHEALNLAQQDPQLRSMLDDRGDPPAAASTLRLSRPSGGTWQAQVSCLPRPEDDRSGWLVTLVDVTDLQRLSEFNLLLAKVDETLAYPHSPDQLLQTICDLAVRHAGLGLAWIGRPDEETGWFHYMASSGPGLGYLDEVRISIRPEVPEGRGPSGQVWRGGRSRYEFKFDDSPTMRPWAELASKYGLAACAVLPIHRAGKMWAELVVYHSELHSFDPSLQQVLETLALNISSGLDRFDLMFREREIQALNESMLQSATVGVVLTRNRVVMRANRRAAEILGARDPRTLEGMSTLDFYADREVGRSVTEGIQEDFRADRRSILQIEGKRLDGETFWMRLEGAPFTREGYDEIWSLIDETEQHRALETQRLLANALASVQEGVILTDANQRTVYINQAFENLTGYSFEQMRGRNCSMLQGPESDPDTIQAIHDALAHEREFVGEILNYRRNGSTFWNLLTINALRDGKGRLTHFVGIQRDITDLRELNARLEHLAFHDELTGLPNRRALDRHFSETLPRVIRGEYVLAVGIMDLDDFKVINDTHGHPCGDRLLKIVVERMRPLMRPDDFFARLGGDEFVVLLQEKQGRRSDRRLHKRFEAIGACFRRPFDIGLKNPIHAGVSMGVALSPQHAEAGGMLLRLADEALFQAKKHKFERTQWWAVYNESLESEPEMAIRPYGDTATKVLGSVEGMLRGEIMQASVEEFYAQLDTDPKAAATLRLLSSEDRDRLKRNQLDHLRFLFAGDTTHQALHEAGKQVGRIHALVGLDNIAMMRWISVYQEILIRRCNTLPVDTRTRYHLIQLLDHRLQDDLKAQLEGSSGIQDRYAAIIDQYMPERGAGWNDAIGREIRLLSRLPGIACAMVLRPSHTEYHDIESIAGTASREMSDLFRTEYGIPDSQALHLPEGSLLAQVWNTLDIMTLASVDQTGADDMFPEPLGETGIRSAACVPVLDEHRLPVALLLLLSNYPSQFESKYMQHFTRNLQLRGNEIWQRSMRPPPPVAHEQALALRRRLFRDGLRVLLQPVVDLHDGRLVKVEALARMELEDGTWLSPDGFLPLLRQTELDTLFRRVLDLALDAQVELERQGLVIDMAVNIAPHTLAETECVKWVHEALVQHGLEPGRLILEILENQRVDRDSRDKVVQQLLGLGVRFAIDDLGSGYSSLQRLASLPFDAIKVDQDLLARVHQDPIQSVSLISAVIQIGRDFGCSVIAEGLESEGMIEMARLLGASMGQGYAIARPMPVSQLADWYRDFDMHDRDRVPQTTLGALAFQWISLRHGSLHTDSMDDCPLTPLMLQVADQPENAALLHAAVHADPGDKDASRQLLDWMQDWVLNQQAAGKK